jgi:hypothetical protein
MSIGYGETENEGDDTNSAQAFSVRNELPLRWTPIWSKYRLVWLTSEFRASKTKEGISLSWSKRHSRAQQDAAIKELEAFKQNFDERHAMMAAVKHISTFVPEVKLDKAVAAPVRLQTHHIVEFSQSSTYSFYADHDRLKKLALRRSVQPLWLVRFNLNTPDRKTLQAFVDPEDGSVLRIDYAARPLESKDY